MLRDINHFKIDYDTDRFAGHPRQGGVFNFGNGEIAIIYNRAPCSYQMETEVHHDYGGYHSRSQQVLARSYDYGQTWDRKNDVVIFDESASIETRRKFLMQTSENPTVPRAKIDLNASDSAIFFGRTWSGEGDPPFMMCYSVRSADRGHNWEMVPTLINPPTSQGAMLKDGHPLVRMPDGTHLGVMSHGKGVWLFGSDDHGLSWEPLGQVCTDPTGWGRPTYAGLLLLPSRRLQCYSLNIGGIRNAIQMCHSDDGGYSWSQPRPLVRWGRSPWAAHHDKDYALGGVFYRSPWPMRLADGRIVVLFARRKLPMGIGIIVSEDDGETWSDEQILRCDAIRWDLGYPVAVEIESGRIFTAYYYTLEDGNNFGGTRFIAGSHFSL